MTTNPIGTTAAYRPRKPRGLLRLVFRLPVFIYRCHLGWLLGHRFLLLVHRGRRTGAIRETVLEVIHYDPETRESIVFSGMGPHADWFKNIEAQPAIEVWTGRLRYVPIHRVLTRSEAADVVARFAREHPWEARLFTPVLKRLGWATGDMTVKGGLPSDLFLIAFRPAEVSRCSRVCR